jgi:putative ABC transport system permease protein
MFRSYFTISFRIFSRQKVYTFINIWELAIGLAGTILIFGYILDELSYDEVHPYTQNTYRIGTHGIFEDGNERKWAVAPALWSSQLKKIIRMFKPYCVPFGLAIPPQLITRTKTKSY